MKNIQVQPASNLQEPIFDMRRLFEDSPIAFYTTDKEGYLTFFNQAAVKLWGRTPELGKDIWCGSWKIFYPDGRPMPLEECPMAVTLKKGVAHENKRITIKRPDGSLRNLLVFPRPIVNKNNGLQGAHNTLVDITDQQYAEIKQATLSAIVESSNDAIISKNLCGKITSWNKGAQRIFKFSEEEVLGKSVKIIIPESRFEEEEEILKKIRAGIKIEPFETLRKNKYGKLIPVSVTISPVKNSCGNIIGASKIARDITAQKQAQEEIKKQATNLKILNSIGKSISRKMSVKHVLQKVTDATTQLTGAAYGAFFYNDVHEDGESMMLFTLSGASRKAFEKFGTPRHTKVFQPTFSGQGILRLDDITKDPRYGQNAPHFGMPKGHLKVVSYLAVPVISNAGEVIGGLIFGHPESGKFKAEHEDLVCNIAAQAAISLDNSRLFERVKNLSDKKDEFIALASHELRTPMTTINGYLQILGKMETEPTSRLFLNKALDQVKKLNTLIEDLLNMSRIEAGKMEFNLEDFDLRAFLFEIAETFSYTCNTHQIIPQLGDHPAIIKGDKQRIEQALLNLLSNAVKYSPGAKNVFLKLELKGENAVVCIQDEGIGLSPEEQKQLFTRFYRAGNTKGISGLGLGLYLTRQIINSHNGEIKVKSALNKGSEFFFTLPLNQQGKS